MSKNRIISKTILKNAIINDKSVAICKVLLNKKNEELSLAEQKRIATGFEIEELFLKYIGINVCNTGSNDISESIKLTKAAIDRGERNIWQASISSDGLFCTVDLLSKSKSLEDHWDIIEVKSCGAPKDSEFNDAAFQKITLERMGLKIDRIVIVSINTNYERVGELDLKQLFKITVVQNKGNNNIEGADEKGVKDFEKRVGLVNKAIEVAKETQEDDSSEGKDLRNKGAHCLKCSMVETCLGQLPDYHAGHVFGKGKVLDEYVRLENLDLTKIDVPDKMTDRQKIFYSAGVKNLEVFDRSLLKNFLGNLVFPIIYFDYETISSAIPRFNKSKPFQQIPFQYTIQIEHEDGRYEKINYIFRGEGDPREDLIKNLEKDMPKTGTVVAWYDAFEKGVNSDLGRFCGKEAFFEEVNSRMTDLMVPFQKLYYYIRDFKGSASIKKIIAGIFPEESYKELDIQEGETASILYEKTLLGEITGEEKDKIHENLITYCDADGYNMFKIKEFLVAKCAQ